MGKFLFILAVFCTGTAFAAGEDFIDSSELWATQESSILPKVGAYGSISYDCAPNCDQLHITVLGAHVGRSTILASSQKELALIPQWFNSIRGDWLVSIPAPDNKMRGVFDHIDHALEWLSGLGKSPIYRDRAPGLDQVKLKNKRTGEVISARESYRHWRLASVVRRWTGLHVFSDPAVNSQDKTVKQEPSSRATEKTADRVESAY